MHCRVPIAVARIFGAVQEQLFLGTLVAQLMALCVGSAI